jgi:hypothetical protein
MSRIVSIHVTADPRVDEVIRSFKLLQRWKSAIKHGELKEIHVCSFVDLNSLNEDSC